MRVLTKHQRRALKIIWDRGSSTNPPTYRQFRRQAVMASYDNCLMVPWCGMWLGIEPDGYTHS